jgi:hypothetical protein
MPTIPAFIIAALEQAGYESPYHNVVIDTFIEHWGDLELQTFIHALALLISGILNLDCPKVVA